MQPGGMGGWSDDGDWAEDESDEAGWEDDDWGATGTQDTYTQEVTFTTKARYLSFGSCFGTSCQILS